MRIDIFRISLYSSAHDLEKGLNNWMAGRGPFSWKEKKKKGFPPIRTLNHRGKKCKTCTCIFINDCDRRRQRERVVGTDGRPRGHHLPLRLTVATQHMWLLRAHGPNLALGMPSPSTSPACHTFTRGLSSKVIIRPYCAPSPNYNMLKYK